MQLAIREIPDQLPNHAGPAALAVRLDVRVENSQIVNRYIEAKFSHWNLGHVVSGCGGKRKPTPKGRQSRCGRTTMQRHSRWGSLSQGPIPGANRASLGYWSCQCSCGLLCRDGAAQDGPIDIRPEVFAAHGAAGSALDGRASFGRNGTDTVTPLADEYRRNGEVSGKTRSAPWCR